jgi:RNA polymerase sporulation-specific sigma factor
MYFRSRKKSAGDLSLSDSIDGDGDGGSLSLMDVISVPDDMLDNIAAAEAGAELRRLVDAALTDRERKIITLRYGLTGAPPLTQRETAEACGISRSYVSRIEKKALEKLREHLER